MFQAAKRTTRGERRLQMIRTVIFLLAGKLDFTRLNPYAPATVHTRRSTEPLLQRSTAPSLFRAQPPTSKASPWPRGLRVPPARKVSQIEQLQIILRVSPRSSPCVIEF